MTTENTQLATTDQQLATARQNPFALTTFAEVEKMAQYIADSGLYAIKKPAQAITLMMMANEERIGMVALMRRVHVFETGQVSQRADYTQAEFEKVGKIVWHIRTNEVCCATFFLNPDIDDDARERGSKRCELLRNLEDLKWTAPRSLEKERKIENELSKMAREGEETILREARDADASGISMSKNGVDRKTNWATSPRSMLQWRCVTEGVKVVAPFVLAGMPADVELQDAKVIEDREAKRIVAEPRPGDESAILEIIAQHDAELSTDISDTRRKTVQGLRVDLVCKLADMGFKAPTQPEAPAPTVAGQPAKTVETTVLPPAANETAPKATRQRRPAQPAQEATAEPVATPATPVAATDGNWETVICPYGSEGGKMKGKTLRQIFDTVHFAAGLGTMVEWFKKQVADKATPSDESLWSAVQQASDRRRAEIEATRPAPEQKAAQPAQKPATPATTATATDWRKYVITGKHPDYSGRELGTLTADEVRNLKGGYLDNMDAERMTQEQKRLKAMVAMALADIAKHEDATDDIPMGDAKHEGEPAYLSDLREAIAVAGLNRNSFFEVCHKNDWLPDDITAIEDITQDIADTLAAEWLIVTAAVRSAQP